MPRNRAKRFLGIPDEFWIAFVIVVGFFLKVVYNINVGWSSATVNGGVWQEYAKTQSGGHISVIQYLYSHHSLPDFDPRQYACFSNPPFYYILSSVLLEIFHRLMRWSIAFSLMLLQFFNAIYVFAGQMAAIGILLKFGIRGRKLLTAVIFLMMFPAFYTLGAALDGLALCFMFMMLSLNTALSWYASRRYKSLRMTAIFAGLGLMTSYACAAVLPPIIYLVVKGARDGRRNDTPIRGQILKGSLVTALLGLWWPVYLLFRFGVPFFYVEASFGMTITASVGERLSLPGISVLRHLHTVGSDMRETNLLGQLFKTAVLDFDALNISLAGTYWLTMILLFIVIAICLISHVMYADILITARIDHVYEMFLVIGELVMIAGYVFTAFRYPYVGTMNFRKIAPIIIFPLVGMSLCGGDEGDKKFERICSRLMSGLVLIMAFAAAFLYGFYA